MLSLHPLEEALACLADDLREEPGRPWQEDYDSFLEKLERYKKILEDNK